MSRIYVTKDLGDVVLAPLGDDFDMWSGDGPVPREVLEAQMRDCVGLLSMLTDRIDEDLLDLAPNLEVVSQMAVGVDNIDVAACRRRGITLGHTPDVLTETVADTAFALLAAIARRLVEASEYVKAGRWGPWEPYTLAGADVHGAVLGIVGMGRIGRAVARRASGFDMEVIYSSRSDAKTPNRRMTLPELLGVADFVVLTVPLNADTRRLIGSQELSLMKSSAFLVNVSRGEVIATDDLVRALEAGEIAGAALDVTDPEPLPRDHPLLALENCIVVPHIASASTSTRMAMGRLAVDNLIAGLAGDALPAEYQEER